MLGTLRRRIHAFVETHLFSIHCTLSGWRQIGHYCSPTSSLMALSVVSWCFAIACVAVVLNLSLAQPNRGQMPSCSTSPKHKFNDPMSYSNANVWQSRNVKLELRVDFARRVIDGTAEIDFDLVDNSETTTRPIVLDTSGLLIRFVDLIQCDYKANPRKALSFHLGNESYGLGRALEIQLDNGTYRHVRLSIDYATSQTATGLYWVPPEQTADGEHPFLYSQCEPMHARSIFPCQDTPSVRTTFDVQMHVPEPLVALVAALPSDKSNSTFNMPMRIPSYLFAIAVGSLKSKRIGVRSTVWAEASFIDAAALEFSETESMLQAAEEIVGVPYQWKKYDILVLPPSFPYFGMENPTLTFVTPTVLAGDRSLTYVIAHEIAHSWSGNLVTNANWQHLWLNEGVTTFLERKIIGSIRGGEQDRQFLAILGNRELRFALAELEPNSELGKLVPGHFNYPEEIFSDVPYEKGHALLYDLEMIVGPSNFKKFLHNWIADNQLESVNTQQFVFAFDCSFPQHQVDWEKWINSTGMPPIDWQYNASQLTTACQNLAQRWMDTPIGEITESSLPLREYAGLSALQKMEFLSILLDARLPLEKVDQLGELYRLDSVQNTEIRFLWLRIGLAARREPTVGSALQFATEQGRIKYNWLLFRELYAWDAVREHVVDTFKRNRHRMTHQLASLVASELNVL